MKAADFLRKRAKQLHTETMAKGDLKFEIVDTHKTLEGIGRIEKAISEMMGANKVRAIYEYAAELSGNPCSPPGYDTATDEIPANLKQIIGNDILALHLTAVIIEWAELKGYGHSESKGGSTKG